MSFNECSQLIELDNRLSKQDNFFQFIFEKITKDNKQNRTVLKGEKSIDIYPVNNHGTRVIPCFKDFNANKFHELTPEIEYAYDTICNKANNIFQVYIACPRNEDFIKHLEIKIPELENEFHGEYRIKVVPYSLDSILRKQQSNCCDKCKN